MRKKCCARMLALAGLCALLLMCAASAAFTDVG